MPTEPTDLCQILPEVTKITILPEAQKPRQGIILHKNPCLHSASKRLGEKALKVPDVIRLFVLILSVQVSTSESWIWMWQCVLDAVCLVIAVGDRLSGCEDYKSRNWHFKCLKVKSLLSRHISP